MEVTETVQEVQQNTANSDKKNKGGCKKIIIAAAVCIAAVVLLFLLIPSLYYRVYLGDRVKGVVTVTIDGKPATIVVDSLASNFEYQEYKTAMHAEGNQLEVSAKANEYGCYDFQFDIEEMPDISFAFYSIQFNWWNVTNFDLQYNIDTQKKIVEYRSEHTELKESGRKSDPIIWEGSYSFEEESRRVCVCSP